MAVLFPTEKDKQRLLEYLERFTESSTERTRNEDTFDAIYIPQEDVFNAESACTAILDCLETIALFFTGRGSLCYRDNHSNGDGGDSPSTVLKGTVLPHVDRSSGRMATRFFSDTAAGAETLGLCNPRVYFASQRETLATIKAHLLSSQELLKALNANTSFILTTDIKVLKAYKRATKGRRCVAKPTMIELPSDASHSPHSSTDGSRPCEHSTGESDEKRLLGLLPELGPPGDVRDSYAKFIQGSTTVLQWISCVLHVVNGESDVPEPGTYVVDVNEADASSVGVQASTPPSYGHERPTPPTGPSDQPVRARRTRTVKVHRYEIHDAHFIFSYLFERTKDFFALEKTQYDARMQCRVLQPAYFHALRDLIGEFTGEISRMEEIAARKPCTERREPGYSPYPYDGFTWPVRSNSHDVSRSAEDPMIVFRPPLSQFCFVRETLRVYLSTCINADDETSLQYYCHLYESFVVDARDVAHVLQDLPRPPRPPLPPPPGTWESTFQSMQMGQSNEEFFTNWTPTAEVRGQLTAGFEAFWDVRDKVQHLKRALESDIRKKNTTHRTRLLDSAVYSEKSSAARASEIWHRNESERITNSTKGGSLWNTAKASLQALASMATCSAELHVYDVDPLFSNLGGNGGGVDDDGVPLTIASPLCKEKTRVLEQVNCLWKVVEVQSAQLEEAYPGLFYRDEKNKWSQRMDDLVKKAGSLSVVFDA